MKKAVAKKPPGKKPEVKQVEKCDWAVKAQDTEYVENTYIGITEAEALKELAEWADGGIVSWTLYKLVPTHIAQMPPASPSITCLATGETTTITL